MERTETYCRRAVSFFFEYDTPKIVHIRSRKVGILSRLIQLCIIAYIIGYVIVYKKGYQMFGDVQSAVATKVKGVAYTNFSLSDINAPAAFRPAYNRIWDVTDFVVPPQENGAFFVATNVIITPNQTRGECGESPHIEGAVCKRDSDCVAGTILDQGHGSMTGRCVSSSQNSSLHVCEIHAWCPVEYDELPLGKKRAVLAESENFTVLIKNYVGFPMFGSQYKRRNILESSNKTYLESCRYNKETDEFCPIFRLGYIIEEAGQSYSQLAVEGGIISVSILWNCDLDYDFLHYCRPSYQFSRLDKPNALLAPGWNFRYSQYYEYNRRTLFKLYGISFVINVEGRAGKFNVVPTLLNLASGLALLGITTVLCDIVVFYLFKKGRYYKDKKYLTVKGDDVFEVAGEESRHASVVSRSGSGSNNYRQFGHVEE